MELRIDVNKDGVENIPKDWEVKNIGNVCQIFGRIGFRGYTINDIVPAHEGAITISPSNIQDGKMDFSKCTYISWFKYDESPEIKIYNGDILLVKTGSTFGKTAFVQDLKEKATINPQLVVLKNISLDSAYLGYIMASKLVQDQIKATIVGGAIPTLSQQLVANFKIPVPCTRSEQTAIATALSDMDNLIAGLEKLIEKKKAIKQGAIQELLRPKEGWAVKKLGELGEIVGGGTPSSFNLQYWNGRINWFTPTEVGFSKYLNESDRKITKKGLDGSSAKILPKGAVLLTTRAGIGDVGILKNEAATNQGFQSIIVNDKNDSEYVYYLLTTLKNEFLRNASGSTFLEISPGKLKSIDVCLPGKNEQAKISEILCELDNEIEVLQSSLLKYKLLKLGMMQELLTGKKRLK